MSNTNISIELAVAIDAGYVCADFDPGQEFDTVDQALCYCYRQGKPREAVKMIVCANMDAGEESFASDLLNRWVDERHDSMYNALAQRPILVTIAQELGVPYNDMAIVVERSGCRFMFIEQGSTDARIITGLFALPGERTLMQGYGKSVSATASSAAILKFIWEVITEIEEEHARPMVSYRAIPLLVYVPCTESEDTDEQTVLDALKKIPGAIPFMAEDYNNQVVPNVHAEDLSAYIRGVCDFNGEEDTPL